MRLLVLTQKIDIADPVLGFFHNWIKKLSVKFDSIAVVCLERGKYDLPSNVKVLSLGKEGGVNRLKYVLNFYKYIWQTRSNYDAVFVHMNQEYVLLGGILWKIFGKKVYMWRNHPKGSLFTRIAIMFSKGVFCTSQFSFTAKFKKTQIMPAGIDTEFFSPDNNILTVPNSLLFLGRISPIKNVEKIIDAASKLNQSGIKFILDIVGDPVNPEDYEYTKLVIKKSKELSLEGLVNFIPAVPQEGAALMFKSHKIYTNLSPSGSLDKTILEAASSGCIPVIMNQSFKGIFPENMIVDNNPEDIANKLGFWLKATNDQVTNESAKLRKFVLENHSLNALMDKLCIEIKK